MKASAWAVLLMVSAGCRQPGTNAALSEINAAPLGLDFGAVTLGQSVTKTVELINSGRGSLQVDRLEVAGTGAARFTLDTTGSFELVDGRTVRVTYAPSRAVLDVGQLTVHSNAGNTASLQIALSGVGVVAEADAGPPGPDGGVQPGTDGGLQPAPRDAGFFTDDSGCPPTWATGTEATAYQVDPAHTGAQPDDRLTLPLCERWRRDLGAQAGYPVVSRGLVFVATTGAPGRMLWALDQYSGATRWGPTVLTGTYAWVALAVGDGAVFALSDSGTLVAFDALSGQQRWIAQVGFTDAAPSVTAAGVFISVNQAVRSYALTNGALRWVRPVAGGSQSSPAVSGDFFSVSYACNQAYGFSTQGVQRWHASAPCSGGGGKTTALYRDRVYTRDSDGQLILDAASGLLVGNHSSRFIPAFAGDLGVYTASGATQGVSLANGQVRWTGPAVVAAPVVVGGHVVLPTAGGVVVLDSQTGVEVSRATLTDIRVVDEQNVSGPLAGLAAANGMLFVPAGTSVVAY